MINRGAVDGGAINESTSNLNDLLDSLNKSSL